MSELTICIPAYRSQRFIVPTLRSLQQQTFNDFQVEIAIEPTEDSYQVWQACEPFLSDKRFKAQENEQILGWAQNIDKLLKKVKTPYFAILPHDDVWHPEYVTILLTALKERPQASVAYADMLLFGEVQAIKFMPIKQASLAKRLLSFYLAGAEAVPWRGITRSKVLTSSNFPFHDYCNSFAVECQWVQQLLLEGEVVRIARPLYFKRKFGTKLDTVSTLWIKSFDVQQKLAALEHHRTSMFRGLAAAPLNSDDKNKITMACETAMLKRFFALFQDRLTLTNIHLQRIEKLQQKIITSYIDSDVQNKIQSRIELIIAKNAVTNQEYLEAEMQARQSVAHDETHWEALLFLAQLLLKKNEVPGALVFATQAAAIAPQCRGINQLLQKCSRKIDQLYAPNLISGQPASSNQHHGQHPTNSMKVQAQNDKHHETVIAILGMHRSGTSCLAGALQAAGLFSGTIDDWKIDNSKGNRENTAIMTLNDAVLKSTNSSWDQPTSEIKWSEHQVKQRDAIAANFSSQSSVWMFKDPRTLLTLPFWQAGISNLKFVGTFRDPMKVAMSLYQRNPISITLRDGIKLWCHYNSLLLKEWQKSPFPLVCFDLEQEKYLEQLAQVIDHLRQYVDLSPSKAQKFYETTLVHQDKIIAAPELSGFDGQEDSDVHLLAAAAKLYEDLKLAAGIKLEVTEPTESTYIVPLSNAIAACRAGLKLQPDNPHLYFILGNSQYKQQDFPAAIASYQKVIKLEPQYSNAYQYLGDSFTKLDQLDEAIKTYQQALKLQPNNLDFYCLLGNLYRRQGNLETAINQYQKAITINPTYLSSYIYLGNTLAQLERPEEAAAVFKEVLKLNSDQIAAYNGLGNIERQQGNHEAALPYYRRSLELNPQQYHIHTALGQCFLRLGQFLEAVATFEKAISIDDSRPAIYNALGNAQLQSGNFSDAIAAYEKAIALNPQQPFGVYKNFGDALSQEGEIERAIFAYSQALKLKPNHPAMLRSLNSMYPMKEK